MLKRLFEWYCAVNTKPANEVLEHRRASIERLVAIIDEQENNELLTSMLVMAVAGTDGRFNQESRLVNEIVNAIREQQAAFPQEIEENGLELRVCAALTVGELLDRRLDSTAKASVGKFAAARAVSTLAFRPLPAERYLRKVLTELSGRAHTTLEDVGTAARRRAPAPQPLPAEIEQATDVPTLISHLAPWLTRTINAVADNARADREELNVLWWLYSAHSEVLDTPLADLPPTVAAFCCGGELGKLALAPAPDNIRHMARHAVERMRDPADIRAQELRVIATNWTDPMLELLADSDFNGTLDDYAVLMPISWLCQRLKDSGLASGWDAEYERKTGLSASAEWRPGDLAVQVFNEQIAHRL